MCISSPTLHPRLPSLRCSSIQQIVSKMASSPSPRGEEPTAPLSWHPIIKTSSPPKIPVPTSIWILCLNSKLSSKDLLKCHLLQEAFLDPPKLS